MSYKRCCQVTEFRKRASCWQAAKCLEADGYMAATVRGGLCGQRLWFSVEQRFPQGVEEQLGRPRTEGCTKFQEG